MEIGTVNFDDLFDFSPEPQQVAQQDAAEARENDAIARLQDNNENKNCKNFLFFKLLIIISKIYD